MPFTDGLEPAAPQYTPEQDAEYQRGLKAMMLAPTLEICRALLAGEAVPLELLRPEWVERYGLKR